MSEKPHILIVDDDNRILKLLKKFLSQHDFLVSTSTSTNEAVELLANFNYDLIILDVMMPEVTGIEFATKIKESGSTMPIVMLTALSEPEDRIKGLEAGANDYVTKPFRLNVLLARLRAQMRTHEQSDDAVFTVGPYSFKPATKVMVHNETDKKTHLTEKETADQVGE